MRCGKKREREGDDARLSFRSREQGVRWFHSLDLPLHSHDSQEAGHDDDASASTAASQRLGIDCPARSDATSLADSCDTSGGRDKRGTSREEEDNEDTGIWSGFLQPSLLPLIRS